MQHQLIIVWHDWLHMVHAPLWNPFGAAASLTLFVLLVGYGLKAMLGRE